MDAPTAASLTAYAFDNARIKVSEDILNDIVIYSTEARINFKSHFIDALIELCGGQSTVIASYGCCVGNYPRNEYKLNAYNLSICVDI